MIRESVILKISLPVIFLISFFLHFVALNQTPFANGWDGYYYIMQSFTFIEKGAMRSPDYSLIYPCYILLSYITKDYILAFKIGSAILSGILTVSAFFISSKLTKNIFTSFLVVAFLLFSPTLYYFTAQFPKNLLGVIFFVWFIYFLNERKLLWTGVFFLLGFMTHRMIGGLSGIILLIGILKGFKFKLLLPFVGIALLIAFILPGIIHIADFERFNNLISESLYIPPLQLIDFFGWDKMSLVWKIEIILLYIAFLVFLGIKLIEIIKNKRIDDASLFLIAALMILSLPIYTFSKASIGFRFYVTFNILSILAIPYLVKNFRNYVQIILIAILLLISTFSFKTYNPDKFDPPYSSYFITMDNANIYLKGKEAELIIAHQALAQIVIIYSDYDATNWQPIDSTKYESVWRIASNIKYYYFKKYLDEEDLIDLKHLQGEYYLLREDKWQKFYMKILDSDNQDLIEKIGLWNPVKPKPEYLLKRRSKDYIH